MRRTKKNILRCIAGLFEAGRLARGGHRIGGLDYSTLAFGSAKMLVKWCGGVNEILESDIDLALNSPDIDWDEFIGQLRRGK